MKKDIYFDENRPDCVPDKGCKDSSIIQEHASGMYGLSNT